MAEKFGLPCRGPCNFLGATRNWIEEDYTYITAVEWDTRQEHLFCNAYDNDNHTLKDEVAPPSVLNNWWNLSLSLLKGHYTETELIR